MYIVGLYHIICLLSSVFFAKWSCLDVYNSETFYSLVFDHKNIYSKGLYDLEAKNMYIMFLEIGENWQLSKW